MTHLRLVIPISFDIKIKDEELKEVNFLCQGEFLTSWNIYGFDDNVQEYNKKLAKIVYDALTKERISIEYNSNHSIVKEEEK